MDMQEQEPAVEESHTPITALSNVSVQSSDIKKLQAEGDHTVEAVIMESRRKLARIKGFSDAKVEKICEAAGKIGCNLNGTFVTAKDLQQQREERVCSAMARYFVSSRPAS